MRGTDAGWEGAGGGEVDRVSHCGAETATCDGGVGWCHGYFGMVESLDERGKYKRRKGRVFIVSQW
jgi:hypothetical protein